jgi:nucleotide-binding universal stress UspA family protein
MFKRIVVATDFGAPSERAIDLAIELVKKFDAHLTVVHTLEIPSYSYVTMSYTSADLITPLVDAAVAALEECMGRVRVALPSASSMFRRGDPTKETLDAVGEVHGDVLVVGTHGRRGVTRALLGSVAEKLVRLASVHVVVAKGER